MQERASVSQDVKSLLAGHFVSDGEFAQIVEKLLSEVAGDDCIVRIEISASDETHVTIYGQQPKPEGAPHETRALLSSESDPVHCRCEIWPRSSASRVPAVAEALVQKIAPLLESHWAAREPKTLLPFLKNPGGPAKFAAAARRFAQAGKPVAILHTDLDHFKSVNSEFGEVVGDQALRVFADRFREAFKDCGVTVRAAGEEFSAILDASDLREVLAKVNAFRLLMEREPIAAIKRTNTCSIGLSIYSDSQCFLSATTEDFVLQDARAAEVRAKADGRNRTALIGPAPEKLPDLAVTTADVLDAALSARRFHEGKDGFEDGFMDALRASLIADILAGTDIKDAIDRLQSQFGLLIGNYATDGKRDPRSLGIIASLDWASLVARALFEATALNDAPLSFANQLAILVDAKGQLEIDIAGKPIALGCSVRADGPIRAEMGRPYYFADRKSHLGVERWMPESASKEHDSLSPVVLLPIGDSAKMVADRCRHLVAAVIDIDDRPTRGGGLPDFWQSNVSRTIRAALTNPNISKIIAVGDEANARQTIAKLQAKGPPDGKELQNRLSMKADDIEAYIRRNIDLQVVDAELVNVLTAIAEAVAELETLDFANRNAIDLLAHKKRRLPISPSDETHRLAITDGLQTRSLADAYPEALQLIRGASLEFDQKEELRGAFRELTGFKIVLSDPLQDNVPDYWRNDKALLDTYYDDVFENPDGLFGKRLKHPYPAGAAISMVEFAVDQVARAAIASTPTRRINLPILPESLDQPLGLSSVQLLPRSRPGGGQLDVVWVWRTVDALVGFPFSAYGSIRWSQNFLAAVNEELTRRGARQLRMGSLTYIALSFHMYLHDGDVEIARTIVQDASL